MCGIVHWGCHYATDKPKTLRLILNVPAVETYGQEKQVGHTGPRASAVVLSPLCSGLVPFGGNRLLGQLVPS